MRKLLHAEDGITITYETTNPVDAILRVKFREESSAREAVKKVCKSILVAMEKEPRVRNIFCSYNPLTDHEYYIVRGTGVFRSLGLSLVMDVNTDNILRLLRKSQ